MTLLERWDIALVPFPFTDKTATKKRAALVLSDVRFNRASNVTILTMITKAQFSDWPGDYPVKDWEGAGLLIPSIVRIKLFSIENSLLVRRLGALKRQDVQGFRSAAQAVLW